MRFIRQSSMHISSWNNDAVAKTKQERWRYNAFERRLNARDYIEALTEYSFGLFGYLYSVSGRGNCGIKIDPRL